MWTRVNNKTNRVLYLIIFSKPVLVTSIDDQFILLSERNLKRHTVILWLGNQIYVTEYKFLCDRYNVFSSSKCKSLS